MSPIETPSLSIAIARLTYRQPNILPKQAEHFAIWVWKAPYPGGYVHHDSIWSETLTQIWLAWEEMFSSRGLPNIPLVHHASKNYVAGLGSSIGIIDIPQVANQQTPTNYTGRLMQHLGVNLWQWLYDGPIQHSLAQSRGIAIGQKQPLRLRLEVRDPDLISLPWEIMQPQAGKQAISLSQQILFSRTTSDVDPLIPVRLTQSLNILLVLGEDTDLEGKANAKLELKKEAAVLAKILQNPQELPLVAEYFNNEKELSKVGCRVDILLQPTPTELTKRLETGNYNVFFYAGHGTPGPNGGLLFLQPDSPMNGTELAQVLVRCRVTLAVFNACWGAWPYQDEQGSLPRSSLAEVLIHHGVPAVLGMRDSIADQEALTFIQALAQSLSERLPIDQAVAIARQQLLTLYKFNQPAWTLPVLYMHPEFNGQLVRPIEDSITELPGLFGEKGVSLKAYLRSVGVPRKVWKLNEAIMRVGRLGENDLVVKEKWASQKHAEIICRNSVTEKGLESAYYLRDYSRFGTLVLTAKGWQKIHHQEIELQSGDLIKFGSPQGQAVEFILERIEEG
jgi:CHAT domain/FHA domain